MSDLIQIKNQVDDLTKEAKTLVTDHAKRLDAIETNFNDFIANAKRPYTFTEVDKGSSSPEMKDFLSKGIHPTEQKDLSVTNDGQGVSVRSQWSDRIFKLIRESSPMRQAASVLQTNSDSIEVLVDRDQPLSDWTGELDPRTKTDASFVSRHKINVHEHYAFPEVTLQMLEDSQGSSGFDVEAWLQGKLSTRFSRQEASAFINGDGVGKPRGILDYDFVPESAFSWSSDPDDYEIGSQYTGENGDLTDPDVLFDLVDSLKADYLPGAAWMMTRKFLNIIRKLKDDKGRYLFEPSLQDGTPGRLLGYPVVLAEDMPTPGTDTVGALFGNFAQAYTVVDRVGLNIQRDSVTKPGWVKYFARKRVGGALTNPEAVKALILGSEPT